MSLTCMIGIVCPVQLYYIIEQYPFIVIDLS